MMTAQKYRRKAFCTAHGRGGLSQHWNDAFTLVELLVVIAILAALLLPALATGTNEDVVLALSKPLA